MTAFDSMITSLVSEPAGEIKPVSLQDYVVWTAQYSFDGLQNLRFGQSFCNYFDVTDHILFYERDTARADQYIRNVYITCSGQ
jgi:hypothetical protein